MIDNLDIIPLKAYNYGANMHVYVYGLEEEGIQGWWWIGLPRWSSD